MTSKKQYYQNINKITALFFILTLINVNLVQAQDKLFFRNGTSLYCKITSINETSLSYKDTTANALVTSVLKTQLILAELKTGEVYIFGTELKSKEQIDPSNETRLQRQERKMKEWKKREDTLSNNILGFYLPAILVGRFGISFERLFSSKSIGVKVPLILTYDSRGILSFMNNPNNSNSNTTITTNKGIGFITGIDLNFYHDIKPRIKYYFGPRIRYGKDMFLDIEGMTVQIQNGIMTSSGKRFTNTLGVGFGFAKLIKVGSSPVKVNENQVFPSISLTWRLGFRL